jgi:hypothetical protein
MLGNIIRCDPSSAWATGKDWLKLRGGSESDSPLMTSVALIGAFGVGNQGIFCDRCWVRSAAAVGAAGSFQVAQRWASG